MTPRPSVEDRGARRALGLAMALAAGLILFESRGLTLFNDELVLFERLRGGFDLEAMLEPFNGHLIAVGSLIFELGLEVIGPEPLAFRLVGVASLLAMAAALYVYLRRHLHPALAAAPVVIVLFLGSSWEVLLWPMSNINTTLGLGAGIVSLLALERLSRRGDLAACVFLVLGLATATYALAFLVAAAVSVLSRPGRLGRAWVVLVPLILYAAWWVWSQRFDQESAVVAGNAWLIPSFALQSLAVVLAAMTGLSASLSGGGLNPTIEIDAGWGRILAVAAVVGLALRVSRGRVSRRFWVSLAALLTYWALLALSFGGDRAPEESRYILPGAVLVAMVAADALAGLRVPKPAVIAVIAVTAVGVSTGIRQLHDGALFLEDYSLRARATLAGIEQAGEAAPPEFEPRADPELAELVPPQLPVTAGPYLEARKRFGSPAFSPEELSEQSPEIREIAEAVRVEALRAGAGADP